MAEECNSLFRFDRSISLGTMLQILALAAGLVWGYSHLDASVGALQASFEDFRKEMRSTTGDLGRRIDSKQDKPYIVQP